MREEREATWKDDARWLGRAALLVVGASALAVLLVIGVRKPWEEPDTGGLPGWCAAALPPPDGVGVPMTQIVRGVQTQGDAAALSVGFRLADTPDDVRPVEDEVLRGLVALARGERPETDIDDAARRYDEAAAEACA